MAHALAAVRSSNAPGCASCGEISSFSVPAGRVPLSRLSMPFSSHLGQKMLSGASSCPRRKLVERVGTVCAAEGDAFFDSSIVQSEIDRLQADYQALLKLGRRYGQFDREGKISYIAEMKNVIERWQIFYKRMELSDDFTAKLCAKQLKSRCGPLGLSNLDLVQSLYSALDEMRDEAEAGQ